MWAVEKSPFRRRTQQPSLMSIAIDGLSEDELYKTLYEHGADYSPNYFLSDYNLEFVLSGFAIDDRGDCCC